MTRSVLRLIAPSSPCEGPAFDEGLTWLESEFTVHYRDDIRQRDGYFAGNHQRRLAEFQEAITDPDATAIVAARGGFGAMKLLPHLSLDAIRQRAIPLVGFSDITALHLLWNLAGVPSLHAPVVTALGRHPEQRGPWRQALLGQAPPLHGKDDWGRPRPVEGMVIGGNLCMLASLVGTPYMPRLDGCILLLEDVGERAYRIDRFLTTLRLHGVFEKVAAVVLGQFIDCFESEGRTVESVLEATFGDAPFPILRDVPVGHGEANQPVPLGRPARLQGCSIRFG